MRGWASMSPAHPSLSFSILAVLDPKDSLSATIYFMAWSRDVPVFLRGTLVAMAFVCLATSAYGLTLDHHQICVRMQPGSKYRDFKCLEAKEVPGPNYFITVFLMSAGIGL